MIFAHERLKMFPIGDEQHIKRAIQLFVPNYLSDDGNSIRRSILSIISLTDEDIKLIHDRIFEAAKKFNISIENHSCCLCDERVLLT
jgi:hypothetical protein